MICVTGAEQSLDALRDRQRRIPEADLHELRLDLLDEPVADVASVAARDPSRLVVTCRPERQGGGYRGDEAARIDLLARAAAAGVGFVDLEDDVDDGAASAVLDAASRGRTRVVRSHHAFAPGADVPGLWRRLRSLRGHVAKLAVAVEDAADLALLLDVGRGRDRPVVLVGMGRAGLASRLLARRFGSAWTYVAAEGGGETAPGQIDWSRARALRLDGSADPAPVVLLGGPQVYGSPGPAVYNALFAAHRAKLVYLPVETARPGETLRLLRALGLAGASVTMPLKERVAEHLDAVDEVAARAGAVNTIFLDGGRLVGTNTDGLGAARAISRRRPLAAARVLVLGAGGTARAVAAAALAEGARVAVLNRTVRRAEELARALGASVARRVDEEPFDVLVNATSVGLESDETPVVDPALLAGRVVLDCVGQPPRTRLAREAEAAGAVAIGGRELWLEQGAAQASLWLGRPVSPEDLRPHLP